MTLEEYFDWAWKDYLKTTPLARSIKELFEKEGEEIVNDHIAFRTFAHPKVGIEKVSKFFVEQGYRACGDYNFKEKKVSAKHFEHDHFPKVFISELRYKELSPSAQKIIEKAMSNMPTDFSSLDYLLRPKHWPSSYADYQVLAKESEYAAWTLALGHRPNHFTVNVNHLRKYNSIAKVNAFLKENGYQLNSSGGEIKGSPEVFLEQSSIMADKGKIAFEEGEREIATCYYEFAFRYPTQEGRLYQGFVEKSADKIFESTDTNR